jgi:hypothetical protein
VEERINVEDIVGATVDEEEETVALNVAPLMLSVWAITHPKQRRSLHTITFHTRYALP